MVLYDYDKFDKECDWCRVHILVKISFYIFSDKTIFKISLNISSFMNNNFSKNYLVRKSWVWEPCITDGHIYSPHLKDCIANLQKCVAFSDPTHGKSNPAKITEPELCEFIILFKYLLLIGI